MLEFVDAADFIAEEPPPMGWLWKPFVPRASLVLLNADEKRCKSMFALNLMIAGAIRRPHFLGYALPPEGFRSIYVQGEIHQRGVWERMTTMLRAQSLPLGAGRIVLNRNRNIALLSPQQWQEFQQQLIRFKPDCVFIDPFGHVMRIDENKADQVGALLQDRIQILRDPPFNTTVFLVHHNSKWNVEAAQRIAAQRARGSSRLSGDPDAVLSFVPAGTSFSMPCSRLEVINRYTRSPKSSLIRPNPQTLWFEPYGKVRERVELALRHLESLREPFHAAAAQDAFAEAGIIADQQRRGIARKVTRYLERACRYGYLEESKSQAGTYRWRRRPPRDVEEEYQLLEYEDEELDDEADEKEEADGN